MSAREVGADGVRTLRLDDGATGRLHVAGAWSWVVEGEVTDAWLEEAAAWAQQEEVLDLRDADGGLLRAVPVDLADADATRALGRRVAAVLQAGDLLLLSGPLGAGKTTFTQGLGAGLGVRGRVTSPTFVLARVHRGPLPLVHVDAYRLREPGTGSTGRPLDLDDLDLDAALEDSVTVVEWGDGLVEHLSEDRLDVRFARVERPADRRTATVTGHGHRWRAVGRG